MAILYSLVARGSVVLAEFSASQSNASAIARQILEKIPGNNDSHVSYSQDRYIFHVKRTDGLTVLCMADDTAGRRIPFAYLEDIHGRFVKTYGRSVHTALAYAMNDEFSRVLSQQMEYYSNDPNADRINRMRGEMSQVRNVMIENIDKVLERGDRLELLVDKTANMQGNTFRFRKQARRFKNTIWWRNVKLMRSMVPCILSLMYSPSGIMLSYWENSRINHKAEGEEGSEGKRNKQQGNVFLYQMKFATITPHCINVIPLFKYQAGSQALWTCVNGLMQYGTRILLFHKRA